MEEFNYYGEPYCTCDYTQYLKQDADPSKVTCEYCNDAIPNCQECEVVNGTVMCTDCRNDYFLNPQGKCVLSSCAEFNSNNICDLCNERDGI